MTIAAVAVASYSYDDASSTRRADDTERAASFSGVLQSAMSATQTKQPDAPDRKDGTSELDQNDAKSEEPNEAGSAGENKKHVRHASHHRANPTPANGVVTSTDALDPQLQSALTRVLDRVRQETGHDATVSETYRTQSRQNALYAQGRQTAGPVVTWTRNSKHTQGRAVDVQLDSTATSADYRALQRIANEEGLGTLGAKDPGHLELRGNGPKLTDATLNIPTEPADASGSGQASIARLAQVARVAEVRTERPAPVARVATVAPTLTVTRQAADEKSSGSSGGDSGSQRGDSRGSYSSLGVTMLSRDPQAPSFTVPGISAPAGSDAVARAEKIMTALDSAPARPLSQITMSVDAGNGTSDKIQLAMRGSSLDTTITTADTRVAQLMSNKADELSRTLSRDGIELRELRVRAATETTTVTAAAASQNAQGSADASTHSRFDRGNAFSQQRDRQEQFDRQRSQQERRNQQRNQRGGRQ